MSNNISITVPNSNQITATQVGNDVSIGVNGGNQQVGVSVNATVGANGASAYDIAVANGFVGTEAQWLASLNGANGVNGINGGSYEHIQGVSSALWVINHTLGYNPNITIVDSTDNRVYGTVTYINLTQITIAFAAANAGKAYLS